MTRKLPIDVLALSPSLDETIFQIFLLALFLFLYLITAAALMEIHLQL